MFEKNVKVRKNIHVPQRDERQIFYKPLLVAMPHHFRFGIDSICGIWYVMQRWLEQFAYRTSLNWWIFALRIFA